MKMFSMRERNKRKHKFVETKVCKADEVRKYFINPKESFGECLNLVWISEIFHASLIKICC